MTFAQSVLAFLKDLRITQKIPAGIEVLNPYKDPYTFSLCEAFYGKYYNDEQPRILLLGINPGRFGAGTTGISFTDPVRLESKCGIRNTLPKKPELSSDFIYRMMDAYGGAQSFFSRYFVSAVSPLGFVRQGKNLNYYDVPALERAVTPFIEKSIERLLFMGIDRKRCFCIGEGKNFDFLEELNEGHRWFEKIIPLPHPRFVMQYRRKKLGEYVENYVSQLA